jgi:hypothetical protein
VELISFDRDARGAGAQEGEHERGQGPGARGQTEADRESPCSMTLS